MEKGCGKRGCGGHDVTQVFASTIERFTNAEPSRFDFARIADTYDRWYETPVGRVYDALEKRAVARALPRSAPGARLLDVGCGTGHWSAFFSEHGFVVTGVDTSPEMIEVAREKRIANASFEVADAHALPFDDGRFDVTAAITTLEFVRDAEAAVREMARCARRPGGSILIGALNALASINERRKANGVPAYADARFLPPAELKAMLAAYGEARVKVTTFVPCATWALPLAPLADLVGRIFHSPYGAFLVGEVRL